MDRGINPFYDEGVDRGIIIYDELSNGVMTNRLIAIMKSFAIRNLGSKLSFILISKQLYQNVPALYGIDIEYARHQLDMIVGVTADGQGFLAKI